MKYEIKKPESEKQRITLEEALKLRYILGIINGFGERVLLVPAVKNRYTHIAEKSAKLDQVQTYLVNMDRNPNARQMVDFAFDTYKEAFEWYLK